MTSKKIFISYKRGEPTTAIAELLYKMIKVNLTAYGFSETFFDKQSIDAGTPWNPVIDQALIETTHFIALLSVDYWLSEQCQQELLDAVERWQQHGLPKLLFILTEELDPNALQMSGNTQSAILNTPFPKVKHLGQINFLGPYDQTGRLSVLKCNDLPALKSQLFKMLQELKAIKVD